MYLRATATYIDGQCEPCAPKKTAEAISANPVQADPSNKAPMFLDEKGNPLPSPTTRSVAENSEAGTAVGAPVTATDPGFDGRQETLTYVLSGADRRQRLRHRQRDGADKGQGCAGLRSHRRAHTLGNGQSYGPVRRNCRNNCEYHGYGRGRSPDDHGGKHLGRL